MSQESPFWTIFGKVSVVVTTIAALAGVWMILSQENEDLELYISAHPYNISPNLQKAISKNFRVFSYSELMDELEKKVHPETLSNSELDLVSTIHDMHTDTWEEINEYFFDNYGGYSKINVTNTGNKTASDIVIDFPERGLAVIRNTDGSQEHIEFNRVIPLKDIRAGSETSIEIWTNSKISPYDLDSISITHKNGVGDTSWPANATGIIWYFATYSYFVPLFIWLVFMVGVYLGVWSKSTKNSNEKSEVVIPQDGSANNEKND
ncbi:MAG: hypothetical protein KDI33_13965 [Halioglobus sp.]|nr:hypothetical protein [Halioglobus sp.]